MERSTIDKGQNGVLDKIEDLLREENNGEYVGFALVTVMTRKDEDDTEFSKLTTMSNMSAAQLPRLMFTVTNDLVQPALHAHEEASDLLERLESKIGVALGVAEDA